MYYHVIENCQRGGVPCYRKVKTYKYFRNMQRFLIKTGKPVWVITANKDYLDKNVPRLGGCQEHYWNNGGWGYAYMPVFSLWYLR